MRPLIYSKNKCEQNQSSWERGCQDIKYYPLKIRKSLKKMRCLYCLTFSYTFESDNDRVYFSYSYPYSYSDLTAFINKLEIDPVRSELY